MADKIIPQDFYVYMHLKATTKEPFYVGKGVKDRAWEKTNRNAWWHHTVKKHDFQVIVVRDGLQEWAAFELECDLIALHGRKDLGLGPLVNLSDGGEGASGVTGPRHSEEFKAEMSIRAKAMWANDEHRSAQSERAKFHNARPEVKAAQSLRSKAMHQDPVFKAANAERMRILSLDPEVAKARSDALNVLWSSETHRAAHAARLRERNQDPAFKEKVRLANQRPEVKGARSDQMKARNADAGYTAKRIAATRAAKSKSVINVTTGMVFDSVAAAVADLQKGAAPKASTTHISGACSGKRQTAYGYTWAYA